MSETQAALAVCLLPGLDGTGRLYRSLAAELATDFDVRVFDYPDDVLGSYPELAASIIARLPQEKPFVLVAESFAGPLSVLVASKRPAGLRGLVIAASFLRSPVTKSKALAQLLQRFPDNLMPPLAVLEILLMGRWRNLQVRQALHSSLQDVPPRVLKSRLLCAMRVDVRGQFDRIGVPVLYLRASRDRLLRKGVALDFAMVARPPRQIDIKAPHFLFQAAASEAAQGIRRFIDDNHISVN